VESSCEVAEEARQVLLMGMGCELAKVMRDTHVQLRAITQGYAEKLFELQLSEQRQHHEKQLAEQRQHYEKQLAEQQKHFEFIYKEQRHYFQQEAAAYRSKKTRLEEALEQANKKFRRSVGLE